MSNDSKPSKPSNKPKPPSDGNFSLPHTFNITSGSALHMLKITGAVATKYNEGPLDYAEIHIENAEPWEPKKSDRKLRRKKQTKPNPQGAGRKPKSPQLKILEDRLYIACHDYKIFWAAWLKIQKSKSLKAKLDSKYASLDTMVKNYSYSPAIMERVLHAGQIASKVREQKCALHLKYLLPENMASLCIEHSADAFLASHMDFLVEVVRLLSLAARTLQIIDQGKTRVGRPLRKTRRDGDQITGTVPSDELVTEMLLGHSEKLAIGAHHTNEIIRVPFHHKFMITLLGHVPAHDIWIDTQQHPNVYDLKQFFELVVIIGRLTAGEIVTTTRAMALRLYDENNINTSDVYNDEGYIELRACRQQMVKRLIRITTDETWSQLTKQMATRKDKITITPYAREGYTIPLF